MTAGSVGAVDANAVAMMVGGIQFKSSISAAIHSSDTPTALSDCELAQNDRQHR